MKLTVRAALKDDTFKMRVRVPAAYRQGLPDGQICRLSCEGRAVLVELRSKTKVDEPVIYIDAAIRKRLGIRAGMTLDFRLRPVGWFGEHLWAFRHTDAAVRIAVQLGILSLLLGFVSLVASGPAIVNLLGFRLQSAIAYAGSDTPLIVFGPTTATTAQAVIAVGAILSPLIVLTGVIWSNLNVQTQIRASVENARLQSKASVVSAGRLRWIDAIREDVSEFLALQLAYRHAFDGVARGGRDRAGWEQRQTEAMRDMEMLYTRIELRLTAGKPKHDRLLVSLPPIIEGSPAVARDQAAIREVKDSARDLFYSEWKRLRGELSRSMPDDVPEIPID